MAECTCPAMREVYRLTVDVPANLPETMITDLFIAVADAVHDWEPQQRDGWDADVLGGVTWTH